MITNRSSFSGLFIARSGIVTAQGNLDVTGQNITNINTEGYTRQRLDIRSVGDGGYKSKYSNQGVKIGYGVEATGIQQLRDASLDARYRTENAQYGYEDILVSGLNDLQGILDETINDGLQAQLSEVMNSFESLLADASGAEYINVVKNNIQLVNKLFNEISGNVETIFRQNVEDMQMEVDNVNLLLSKIAGLNDLIRTEKMVGNTALELLDERNLMLDKLSGLMDIRYQLDPNDYESMSIYFMDSNGNKQILVDNEDYVEFELRPSADEIGRGTNISINIKNEEYTYTYAENGAILTQEENEHYIEGVPPIQSIYVFGDDMENGSLGAYFDLLNADGDVENRGIEYYMERLDTMANTFAQMVNDINRGSIFDKNGKMQITKDYLHDILASDDQRLYTQNGDVFDIDLLREAVYATADIFPQYLADANGELLKDAAGNYIAADETVYKDNGKYYTQNTTGYNNGFATVDLTTAGIEATRVYWGGKKDDNDNKIYISEAQYKELGETGHIQGIDGVQENYRIETLEPKNELTQIPSQYVVDENGEFLKHINDEGKKEYILVDSTKSPNKPVIYERDVKDDDGNFLYTNYYTEDQKDKYLAANPRTDESEFKVREEEKVALSKVYKNEANDVIAQKEYDDLTDDEKKNYAALYEDVPPLYLYSTDKNLLVTNNNTDKITASNITISKEWMQDDKVLVNSIKQFAATGDNDNIQRFITVFSDTLVFHSDKYGDMFKGTLQGCSSNIMTTVGLDINIHTSLATSYETNLNSINSSRMAVSSVDENEETANLMMYQKAFQASSRVMTTVDEMLDKLINGTGMVGR